MQKYSCSGPRLDWTFLDLRLPSSLRTLSALSLTARIERRSGVFLSRASPWYEMNADGMQSVIPIPFLRRNAGARHVPGRVAAGLEGGAQASAGEARRVRLALHQLLAGEALDDLALSRYLDEGVVLFGGRAGHGLEPVSEVGGPVLERPFLHCVGDGVRGLYVELLALLNALSQLRVENHGKLCLHHLVVERVLAEIVGDCEVLLFLDRVRSFGCDRWSNLLH